METSPVGVVVFDGGTGRPASLNREARRLVDGLNAPGRPPEELLGALTCRFSDGREIATKRPVQQLHRDRQHQSASSGHVERIAASRFFLGVSTVGGCPQP